MREILSDQSLFLLPAGVVRTEKTVKYIKDLHKKLFAGTVDEQLDRVGRPDIKARNRELPLAMEIPDRMKQLIKELEKKETVGLLDLLEFHVHFEKIAPFNAGNGRVG